MRCRKCGVKAVINMQQHRLSLCREHFLDWMMRQIENSVENYKMFSKNERLLLAVSGGKDSLALWDILWRLEYKVDGLYINLGIDNENNYSNQSQQRAQEFAELRNLNLTIFNLKNETGHSITDLASENYRGQKKPCSVCGLVKRHVMNRYAIDKGHDVLVTAHNLDDEAAILLSNTLNWSLSFLSRGQPYLPAKHGLVRKVKPFYKTYERESAAYAILRNINYIDDECPFSKNSKQLIFKENFNEWEESMPGTKLRFYINYLQALDHGAFPDRQQDNEILINQQCQSCGQPTISEGLCSYCRLFK